MSTDNNTDSINILHISDLHIGILNQDTLWPSCEHTFLQDLKRLYPQTGPWDLVIFSGDLTQKGSIDEFNSLTSHLEKLWGEFNRLGSNPNLFITPGNHDLSRPSDVADSYALSFKHWWQEDGLREQFWKNPTSKNRNAINEWFKNYIDWESKLSNVIPTLKTKKGILPGDASVVYKKNSTSLGLVSLNSAWLQCTAGNFKGQLCVDPAQLIAVTNGNPNEWCQENNFNIVLTHHPIDWLHIESIKSWNSDIYPTYRFDMHLFGHMHESKSSQTSISGGDARLEIQASSLFGLEKYQEQIKRNHGYTIIQLHSDQAKLKKNLRIWPRKAITDASGDITLGPDTSWKFGDDDRSCVIELNKSAIKNVSLKDSDPIERILNATKPSDILSQFIRPIVNLAAHSLVRIHEQRQMTETLLKYRIAWLVSEWGVGTNEFLASVQLQNQIFSKTAPIYHIEVQTGKTADEISTCMVKELGLSLEELSQIIAEAGKCFFVLDRIPGAEGQIGTGSGSGIEISTDNVLNDIAKIVSDFCPEAYIIINSRIISTDQNQKSIELKPLDEVDTAQYIKSHINGGSFLADQESASRIFRHTDGFPYRIDSALINIKIGGLSGLQEVDADVFGRANSSEVAPRAVVLAINELTSSKEEVFSRSLRLLRVLSLFPQGVQLNRIRRFYGAHGFHNDHAKILLDRALIESLESHFIENNKNIEIQEGQALVVPRPIREYIINITPISEFKILSEKAVALYFGNSWQLKGIKSPSFVNFKKSDCDVREIGNASTMILRVTRYVVESRSLPKLNKLLALAYAYASDLKLGGHFRSTSSFLSDFFELIKDHKDDLDLSYVEQRYAQALRMQSDHQKAREIFDRCLPLAKDNNRKQSILLGIALCSESLGDEPEVTIEIAKKCEKINSRTASGLQAKSIILTQSALNDTDKEKKRKQLQESARNKKSFVVSNNIGLDRAREASDVKMKKSIIELVIKDAREGNDGYNFVRGNLALAKIYLGEDKEIPQALLAICINIYRYLFNQRMYLLFSECHDILWVSFSKSNNIESLLSLFRHSSFIWRLRGKLNEEANAIREIAPLLEQTISSSRLHLDRQIKYFINRNIQISDSASLIHQIQK